MKSKFKHANIQFISRDYTKCQETSYTGAHTNCPSCNGEFFLTRGYWIILNKDFRDIKAGQRFYLTIQDYKDSLKN